MMKPISAAMPVVDDDRPPPSKEVVQSVLIGNKKAAFCSGFVVLK
jgi:hypothetical protein